MDDAPNAIQRLVARVRKLGTWLRFFLLTSFWTVGLAALSYTAHACISKYYPITSDDGVVKVALKGLPKELAIAALIAWVLGFSIEYWNRRRHDELTDSVESQRAVMLRDISAGVFKAVYGRDVPQPVFEQFNKHVIESVFVRENYRIDITVESVATPSSEVGSSAVQDRAKVTVQESFFVRNLTDVTQSWKVQMTIEERTFLQSSAQESHFQYFSVTPNDAGTAKPVVYSRNPKRGEEDIATKLHRSSPEEDNCDPIQELRLDIDIPARSRVFVDVCQDLLYAADGGDAYCTRQPSDGLQITVVVPKRDFEVSVFALHPEDAIRRSRSGDLLRQKYELPHALLPGQGIYCHWSPVNRHPPANNEIAKSGEAR